MAKQFAGFTEQQKNIILARNGYKGRPLQNDEALNLIASDAKYNSAYNMAYEKAMKLVPGARAMARPMATGGFVFPSKDARGTVNRLKEIDNPEYAESAVAQQSSAVNQMQQTFARPQDQMTPARGFAEGGVNRLSDLALRQSRPGEEPPAQVITAPITDIATQNRRYNPRITKDVRPELDLSRPSRPKRGEEGNFYGNAELQGNLLQDQGPQAYRPPKAGGDAPAVEDPAATFLNTAQQAYSDALAAQQLARDALAANPTDESLVTALTAADSQVAQSNEAVSQAQSQFQQTSMPTPSELIQASTKDPLSLVTQADVTKTTNEQAAAGSIAVGTGQAADTTEAATTAANAAGDVVAPTNEGAATATTTGTSAATQALADDSAAAQGTISGDATVDAATMSPAELAQLKLDTPQIEDGVQVKAPDERVLEDGELIEGSTVDMDRVREETNFEAATGTPSTDATVQGQLTGLMRDFEGGKQPAWAAGAMRAASAAMAARGLGASSMAGQAIIQAAMESALPIAQMDAATFSRFEEQNLSNRQQASMFAAEKRAEFLGLEFTQEFQSRVANASKISEIANINFTAEQQIALENARLTQEVDLANLNVASAKTLSDAAALSQLDLTNLNNRQQAQVQNAKAFLDMDMANLNNEQQMAMFKSQSVANSILTDAAAENAAAQFNASSENQTNQFFANIATQVSEFNVEQKNAISKFNAGEANALEKFNATQISQREQFNAQNSLIVSQANAQWYQKIATTDNAAINQSNRDAAAQANDMSALGFSAYMQEVRDLMSYAWQTNNNDADRATRLAEAKLTKEAAEYAAKVSKSAGLWASIGSVAATIIAK
tara:strand:- start:1496 stop:4024 length:2529 start_codon:yes stop_codon:yes gene_type:complete